MRFVLNGRRTDVDAPPLKRLLDVLREDCGLAGTKEGCGEGECGACSILLNGDCVDSCLVLVGQLADGDRIETIEGLRGAGRLTLLQRHFIDDGGAQCGACTPGMILAAEALLRRNPSPTRDEIREAIAGNLCRCTGYVKIVDAIERAAAAMRGEG
jgi:carbon-monoxide dehydrogenase small subunit